MTIENKQPIYPYVSFPTFKVFVRHLHETVVTDQIDTTMMPSNFSGSSRAAVTSALKSLGLIDAQNNTTQGLKDLVSAFEGKEWPAMVKKHILPAYTNIPEGFDLKSATRKQVDGMFSDITSQMRTKSIRFFLTANREAGIEYSPHLKIRKRAVLQKKRSGASTPRKKKPAKNVDKPETPKVDIKPKGSFDQPIPIASEFPCYIRVPLDITVGQVGLVKAAVAFIEAIAKQNEES